MLNPGVPASNRLERGMDGRSRLKTGAPTEETGLNALIPRFQAPALPAPHSIDTVRP